MKVNIVTVFNSLNPGSFLQATSLYSAIEMMGYDVCFLDIKARSIRKQALVESLYLIKNGLFSSIPDKWKIVRLYLELLKKYQISTQINKEDLYVLGSDEIWNVERENMSKYPAFWGKGLGYSKCISYAPSVNNASSKQLCKYDFVRESLMGLHDISVRDQKSLNELSTLTDRPITEVCDPTLLVYPGRYEKLVGQCPFDEFLLVYIYKGSVSDEDVNSIVNFAREKKKKIIAFGASHKWVDININGDPNDFLLYVKHADYVCTSTFHGTMLSLIYKKQFAVLGKKNRKVHELLDSFGIERFADSTNLKKILLEAYDIEMCDKKMKYMRDKGLEFLKNNLEQMAIMNK